MSRKKKLVNNTNIPQYAIERFARCVFDDIRADYANEEIQKEFAIWQAEQAARKAELKLHKKARAASTAALVFYFSFFFRGPRGFDSGRMGTPFGKYVCSYLAK